MQNPDSPVLITGAQGQLGAALSRRLLPQAIAFGRQQFDLSHPETFVQSFDRYRPSIVINCGAYTGVDAAESDAELCFAINGLAVERLAWLCHEFDCTLVQISTDYVFGGQSLERPWRESDAPSPVGVYARSKWAGELAAAQCRKHFIVRTCGLYGGPRRSNFVEKMLRLAQSRSVVRVVSDQRCTPTYAEDLAEAIAYLLTTKAYGTYHVTNTGEATWHEFAVETYRLSNLAVDVQAITSAEFAAPAVRPNYSVLDNRKFVELWGMGLRPWREALAEYLLRQRPLNA